jgi:hypothetical protein
MQRGPSAGPAGAGIGIVTPVPITPSLSIKPSRKPIVSPTPTLKPSATSSTGQSRTLTESDSGTTVTIRVGDVLDVSLPSEYHQPEASGTVLVRTSADGGYPTGKRATATFKAAHAGSTDISSSTDYECLHTTPQCGIPQRLWTVHVIVTE